LEAESTLLTWEGGGGVVGFGSAMAQWNCGPRQELASGRKMTSCARVAWRKGNFVWKYSTGDSVEQETRKGRTEHNRRWKGPECNNGIRDWGLRLHQWCKRKFNKTFKKILGLEIGKRAIGISSGLLTIENWTLWRGQPPSKTEKETAYRVRAGYGGAPATPGVMAPIGVCVCVCVCVCVREREREREREIERKKNFGWWGYI
jgi:hypothetical protein